jgi:bacterioferritin (cytochrome b1)
MPSESDSLLIEVLNGLLAIELNSIFRFAEGCAPYPDAARGLRSALHEMAETGVDHARDLHELIESLGGTPVPRSVRGEEQYMAFLSLKFMLPKLIAAKQQAMARYTRALELAADAPSAAKSMLQAHLERHRMQLAVLKRSVAPE